MIDNSPYPIFKISEMTHDHLVLTNRKSINTQERPRHGSKLWTTRRGFIITHQWITTFYLPVLNSDPPDGYQTITHPQTHSW